jgi:pyruvate,orthophosphate dikinase
VYLFVDGKAEGDAKMRALLGGKGAGIAEMTNVGMPVPPGFTITTAACNAYFASGKKLPPGLWDQVQKALDRVEKSTGKKLGDTQNPLLVSVRSGAAMSMPGMMDTVLNLGLNDETRNALEKLTKNPRFAWDAYRRFISLFGRIVLGIRGASTTDPEQKGPFEHALEKKKAATGAKTDADLKPEALRKLVDEYKAIVRQETKKDFPTDVNEQLRLAIEAVFDSWFGKRAVDYRNAFKIEHTLGTAVNVQSMVFGNMGDDSGTGVAFTRDPNTGAKELYGEYLVNAQGEDVVAGVRTPSKIAQMKQEMPKVYAQFEKIAQRLEKHYRDVQDMEFTIERAKLYMLQTRSAKRTARAAVKIAIDMYREKLIIKDEALQRVDPMHVEQLLLPRFDEAEVEKARKTGRFLAKGLNASPGAATGRAVFDADRAVELKGSKQLVVLVRPETSPDDFHGMIAATGILTARGGSTSHAAVVARGLGLPCVAGVAALDIDLQKRQMRVGDKTVREGDAISIDGTTGEVFLGELPTIQPNFREEKELIELLTWADQRRTLGVWVNADTPEECRLARELGAEGVGLARTEHMFRQADRLPIVQDMIMADEVDGRKKALAKLLPFQQGDFFEMYKAMDGLSVVIRLIDPPLHEFLREYADVDVDIAVMRATGKDGAELERKERIERRLQQLHEDNPMLGLRGCRLLLVYPEILEMQIRAILGAAIDASEKGIKAKPEIMMPLVGVMGELDRLQEQVLAVADAVFKERGKKVPYKFGTMIEIPRACLIADEIATKAEFFSFGTNDLTQTILGISRDDAQKSFLTKYVEQKIIPADPFQVLDRDGVGAMMRIAIERGRKTRPGLKIGICGEHGGDPSSIAFCHEAGLTYVSPSTYRVPVARLAAAQAAIAGAGEKDR